MKTLLGEFKLHALPLYWLWLSPSFEQTNRMLRWIRNPYIDLSFQSSGGSLTRVLERPGLWMPEAELQQLIKDLRSVQASLGIGALDYGVLKGEKETLDRIVITIIYDNNRKAVAFNALTLMTCLIRGKIETVVHLGLVIVDPTYRAKGLSWVLYGLTTFLLFFKNKFRPVYISNVTQVPSIIGNVCESFGNVFPNPLTQSRQTFEHLQVARQIMGQHRAVFGVGEEAEFDDQTFVIKNAYTGGSDNLKKTFEQANKHRNPVYNDFCEKFLDYNRGDDVLQIGQMDLKTYYHYLIHSVSNSGFLVVLYKIVFQVLESSLIPVFQWFSVNKQMNHLRPRGPK